MKKKHSICIGTTEICGIIWKLGRAFDKMGVDYCAYLLQANIFIGTDKPEYKNSRLNFHAMISERIHTELDRHHTLKAAIWQFVEAIIIILLFLQSLILHDTYIYVFTQGFFRGNPFLYRIEFLEFLLLKIFRKKVITICCGSDTRAPYCDVVNSDGSLEKMARTTKRHARRVHMLDRFTTVIDNPATANMHCRSYINYQCIGNPVDENECVKDKFTGRHEDRETIVIFHAPSVPEVKGTYQIREVVEKLKKKGYSIEYIEKSGVPHEEILGEMRNCDIVVNQLYSDTPLSMLDVEAGLNKIPVITCGYYARYYAKETPQPLSPGCFCEPGQLEEKLIEYIKDPKKRKEMGEKSYEYIKNHLMAEQVAKKLLRIINDDIPEEWFFDPSKSEYIWGCGISKEKVKERIYYMVEHHGMRALQVPKNTKLYKKYKKCYQQLMKKTFV